MAQQRSIYEGLEDDIIRSQSTTDFGASTGSEFSPVGFMIFGLLAKSFAAFGTAEQRKYILESKAISARYAKGQAKINAEQAEIMSDLYIKRGHEQIAQRTQEARKAKSAQKVSAAGRGVAIGVGSAAEIQQSIESAKDADYLTINANTERAAMGAKTQALNFRNKAIMFGVQEKAFSGSAGLVDPGRDAFNTLLTGAGNVALAYSRYGL